MPAKPASGGWACVGEGGKKNFYLRFSFISSRKFQLTQYF